MRRIRLRIAYDGTNYCGWQIQPNGISIEEVVNKELSRLLKEEIRIVGSSRTDSGVHSYGTVAIFDTESQIPGEKIAFALNRSLPDDIVIRESMEIDSDFHPRRNPSIKTYEYRILNTTFPMPELRHSTYFYYYPLDVDKMKEAASHLVGEHDFCSFCSIKTNVEDTVREITELSVEKTGELITIRVKGYGFLYNMVRIIAGTLIQVGGGKRDPEEIAKIIAGKNRSLAGPTAPPQGLTLIRVDYLEDLEREKNS